ncbi:MAG: glycosyltransferase family 2 protein [Opitutae bacterium]|nr:glycosyltransferase family 2 protein [Opitutae bacterium]
MSSGFVSIIIPCYNAAPWLAQTLDSALEQSWPHKEIILVDDGSTDQSLRIAREYEARGVKIIIQSNRGASAARNLGLAAARGDFIQFLDADDLLSAGKISAQITLLLHRPAGTLATCAWGRFQQTPESARFVDDAVCRDFQPVEFLVLAGETGAMMHPSCWLVPGNLARQAGPWNESLSLNDDGEYFSRVILASAGLAYCADPAAKSYYRSGLPGSLSQSRSTPARHSQFRSLELITASLLAAEDTPRTRRACAGYWRRFVHDFYPFPHDLIQRAEAHVQQFGESVGRPPMGPKTATLAGVIGWRSVWRLKHLLHR